MTIIESLKGKVIVSSQAMPGEPFYDEKAMMALMQSVVNGGAAGLRVAGKRDVINATTFGIPVVGLTKPDKLPENWRSVVYITPGIKEVKELIEAGADIIMLDNMSVEDMKTAVSLTKGKAQTECSGNVTKENIARLVDIGVDFISSGALTHSAPILDLSLKNLHAI